jgi:phospholipase/lecithinase/hemolysin
VVIFGDSLSDTGNTTHLLKSLREEESAAFLVAPFKIFVLNKMIEFAKEYYVPQIVLNTGLTMVTEYFDGELGPYIAHLINKVKLVPLLPGKPYWESRFTNGRVWNEYLAQMMYIQKSNKDVYTNLAFGGSWAATYDYQLSVWNLIRHPLGTIKTLIVGKLIPPSLGLTVQAYLLQHNKLNDQTLYFVFTGGNDYLNVLFFQDNYDSVVMSKYVDNVIESISTAVLKLKKKGAKRFVIMGIPDVGLTPKYVNSIDRDVLSTAVDMHNKRLASRIEEWKYAYPDVDFLFIDTALYMQKGLSDPEYYGFSDLTEPCIDVKFPMFHNLTSSPFNKNFVLQYAHVLQYKDKSLASNEENYTMCENPDKYLFWDEVHPTTRAHHFLAFEICTAMKEHGYIVACTKPDPSI